MVDPDRLRRLADTSNQVTLQESTFRRTTGPHLASVSAAVVSCNGFCREDAVMGAVHLISKAFVASVLDARTSELHPL